MSLYPDLVACGISFMHFSFHVSGGVKEIDGFWKARGFERSLGRLLVAGYSRKGRTHTVWLRWARSHATCCDVLMGLEARRPASVYPRLPVDKHRLRESDFRDFLGLFKRKQVPQGVIARYAFPWDKSLDPMIHLPPRVKPRSLSLDVFDEKERRVMNVTYERSGAGWLAIVVPAGHLQFLDEPISDSFFKVPYDTACLLATSLIQERLEPL